MLPLPETHSAQKNTKLVCIPAVRVICEPPNVVDMEKVVEEGIART